MIRLITEHAQLIDWTDEKPHPLPENLVFLDLLNPSRSEEVEAEQWLEYTLPTREEMQEIEESSRLYSEKGALYMTAWVPVGLETPEPDTSAITFVVSPDTLTTVRYSDPLAFRVLADQVRRQCSTPVSSDAVFLLLVEMIVARIADTLQNIETDLRGVSRDIFAVDPNRADGGKANCDLNEVIKLLGRRNALVANLRECLVSIARMLQYFLNNAAPWMKGELAAQFRSVARDVKSLDDYTNQQTQEMAFLLDSTLGLQHPAEPDYQDLHRRQRALHAPHAHRQHLWHERETSRRGKPPRLPAGDGHRGHVRHPSGLVLQEEEAALAASPQTEDLRSGKSEAVKSDK
jgi:magnesium transporter